jgi:hypothetical protein
VLCPLCSHAYVPPVELAAAHTFLCLSCPPAAHTSLCASRARQREPACGRGRAVRPGHRDQPGGAGAADQRALHPRPGQPAVTAGGQRTPRGLALGGVG